jgi:hypothetical protein
MNVPPFERIALSERNSQATVPTTLFKVSYKSSVIRRTSQQEDFYKKFAKAYCAIEAKQFLPHPAPNRTNKEFTICAA